MNASSPIRFDVLRRLCAVPFVLLVLSACGKVPAEQAGPGGMPPPEVTVEAVQLKTVPLVIELPATLAGSREVEIRARVSGILESRNFEEGGAVRRGQSLFTLDSAPLAAVVARNEADVAAAQARRDQAQRNLSRLKPLREEKAVAQKEYDDAVSAEAIAAADVKAAEARLREARLDLGYAKVESPINGVASRALVSEGTLVSGPEMLLTRVSQLDPVHVRFGLSEQEQARLRSEAESGALVLPQGGHWKATVKLPDGSLYGQSGVVNFSDVRISSETGTSELQAVVPNPKAQLRPGQFVRVVLEGASRKNAIVVPQRAVLDGGNGKFVYLLGQGDKGMQIAKPASVEVGEWVRLDGSGNGWVIRKGLKPGDPVIVDGVARIFFPGMPVRLAAPGAAGQGAPGGPGAAGAPKGQALQKSAPPAAGKEAPPSPAAAK
jgi:membrane fusion protein, multidrug efflux system